MYVKISGMNIFSLKNFKSELLWAYYIHKI